MMTRAGQTAIVASLATTFALSFLSAEDKLPDKNLSDFKLGKTVRGDEVTLENLKGKVVVVEYWGVT